MNTNLTFKAQDKHNVKRFLTKTCGINVAEVDQYLTQVDGKWGTWVKEVNGKPAPVRHADAAMEDPVDPVAAPAPAPAAAEVEEQADPVEAKAVSAFGAFALGQLTGTGSAAPAAAPAARPANSTGLKIQKDRPEQNGVRRQSAGSVGDKLWAIYDAAGPDITLEQAKAAAVAAGLSATSAAIALYNWRKYNGIPAKVGAKKD